MATKEAINHPQHYGGDTTYEAIKVIEAWGLGFADGNAVKYICRWRQKGWIEDLKKALWYLTRFLEQEQRKIAHAANDPLVQEVEAKVSAKLRAVRDRRTSPRRRAR